MTDALVVLMRWPRRGEGKTRLAGNLGVDRAHELHRAFVADTLAWPLPRPRILAVAPDAAAIASARAAAPDAVVVPQARGDLGTRIAGALASGFAGGADRCVLVGTDSPSLPHHLLDAGLALAGAEGAAMVPADDGGFVALCVHRDAVAQHGLDWLHCGIEWSTARTAAQTIAAATRRGLTVGTTTAWYDVDEACDLVRLHADLRASPARAPRTLRCLDRLSVAAALEAAS